MANQQAWATGTGIAENDIARQRELEDEQRQARLKVLQEDAETPQDKIAAVDAVYHKDPGVLKQHVENLTRRLTGKPTQPVVSPQAAQAARVAPLAARGATPQQQQQQGAIQTFTKEGEIQNQQTVQAAQQKQAQTFALIDKYITDPEQNKAAKEDYVRTQAGIAKTFKNLPGAAGQPYKTPNGTWVRPVQAADGSITEEPMPASYAGPAPKPLPPATQYLQLYTKKILADKKQGPPLTPEESAQLQAAKATMDEAGVSRMEALGREYAQYHITPVTDDSGMVVDVPVASALSRAKSGNPYAAAVVGSPTGADKQHQMLAQSALTQIDTMEKILQKDPSLTGPGAGQWTAFTRWLGSNSDDSQQFLAAATFLSEHGVGVFGGRNVHSIEDLQNLFGSLKTNPKALYAALEQAKQTMGIWANAGGRLPAPRAPGATPTPQGNGAKKKWSKSKWAAANPGKDANAAAQQAQQQGREVIP